MAGRALACGGRCLCTALLRVIVRADQRVRRLRFESERGERCEVPSVADDADLGVTFFAILLPWTTGLVSLAALNTDGQVLPP